MSYVPHIVTADGLTMFYHGESLSVTASHPKWKDILEALRARDYDTVVRLTHLPTAFKPWEHADPEFQVRDGALYLGERALPSEMSEKALRMLESGQDPLPLFRCLRKLLRNPSATCQRAALVFFTKIGATIHEDGDFIAFKGVRHDYMDCHSGTISNRVGDHPKRLERWEVDDNSKVLCSRGYHVGDQVYARGFGQRTMVAKFSPEDVVSIPDECREKCRVTYYEIIAEVPRPVEPGEVYHPTHGWERQRFFVRLQHEGTEEVIELDAVDAADARSRVSKWIKPGAVILDVSSELDDDDTELDDDGDIEDDGEF